MLSIRDTDRYHLLKSRFELLEQILSSFYISSISDRMINIKRILIFTIVIRFDLILQKKKYLNQQVITRTRSQSHLSI